FLDRLSTEYEQAPVRVQLGTASADATTYVSRLEPVQGLYPTRQYLNTLMVGAEEFQLSHDYIEHLRTTTALEDVQREPIVSGVDTRAVLTAESVPHEPV